MAAFEIRTVITERYEVAVPANPYAVIVEVSKAMAEIKQVAETWGIDTRYDDFALVRTGDDEIIFYIERRVPR